MARSGHATPRLVGGLCPFFWRARRAELLDTFQNVPGTAWAGEGARECGHAHRPPTPATAFPPGASLHWLQTPRAWLQVAATHLEVQSHRGQRDLRAPPGTAAPLPGARCTGRELSSWTGNVAVHLRRARRLEEVQTTLWDPLAPFPHSPR